MLRLMQFERGVSRTTSQQRDVIFTSSGQNEEQEQTTVAENWGWGSFLDLRFGVGFQLDPAEKMVIFDQNGTVWRLCT